MCRTHWQRRINFLYMEIVRDISSKKSISLKKGYTNTLVMSALFQQLSIFKLFTSNSSLFILILFYKNQLKPIASKHQVFYWTWVDFEAKQIAIRYLSMKQSIFDWFLATSVFTSLKHITNLTRWIPFWPFGFNSPINPTNYK